MAEGQEGRRHHGAKMRHRRCRGRDRIRPKIVTNFKPKKESQKWARHNVQAKQREKEKWILGTSSSPTYRRGEETEERAEQVFLYLLNKQVFIKGRRIVKIERTFHWSQPDREGIDFWLTMLDSKDVESRIPVQVKSSWSKDDADYYLAKNICFSALCPTQKFISAVGSAKRALSDFVR
jgi:hypothetical protein